MTETGLRHNMFVYADDGGVADRVAPFLGDGLERDEAVVAVVDDRGHEVLRDALGADAGAVVFLDRAEFYTRPEAAIATLDASLRGLLANGASAVRAYGEPLPHDEPEQRRAWTRYEAIVNAALAHHPLWVLCGYDERVTPAEILDAAQRTHTDALTDGWRACAGYAAPERVLRDLDRDPPELPGLRTVPLDGGAGPFRRALRAEMDRDGVPEAVAEALLIAAGEVYANAERHGGGIRVLRVGRDDGRFVCEISDRGPGVDDPLAGHLPPRGDGASAAGLWVARQLTHRLELRSRPGAGLTVQLWV